MDENFFDEMVKAIRLGLKLGFTIGRGFLWLTDWPKNRPPYQKLIDEQRKADQYDESGRRPPQSKIWARIFRRGDR